MSSSQVRGHLVYPLEFNRSCPRRTPDIQGLYHLSKPENYPTRKQVRFATNARVKGAQEGESGAKTSEIIVSWVRQALTKPPQE